MLKKILRYIGNAITFFIVILIILSVVSMYRYRQNPGKVPSVLGYSTMSVLTGSMRPYLEPGDIIVDKVVDAEEIRVGDVITYRVGSSIVTHRVAEVLINGDKIAFRTRGDANNTDDGGTVESQDIIGKVVLKVPYGGYIARFIRSPFGLMIVIGIPVMIMLGGELKVLLSEDSKKKRQEKESEDSVDIN